VKEVHRLARGAAGAVSSTRNLETPTDFLCRKTCTEVILRDNGQIRPDPQKVLGIVDAGCFTPFGKGVGPSAKIANLPQQSRP
jgi:hypothetical protein